MACTVQRLQYLTPVLLDRAAVWIAAEGTRPGAHDGSAALVCLCLCLCTSAHSRVHLVRGSCALVQFVEVHWISLDQEATPSEAAFEDECVRPRGPI